MAFLTLSTCTFCLAPEDYNSCVKMLETAMDAGFDGFEIDMYPGGRDVSNLIRALKDTRVPVVAVHGILGPGSCSPDRAIRQKTVAEAAAYLEKFLSTDSGADKKIPFILATVQKDIHDIGKNIVGTVLKNNGFNVIDLGKDVPPEVIIDRAVAENAELIGLSALMIDTMDGGMRDTIALARKRGLTNLKFIVGGAVVDAAFAGEVGAVYAANPQAVVDAAKKLLEN